MLEKKLLITALICSLAGIFIILSISESIEAKKYDIIKITKENLNENVIITGSIIKITETDELIITKVKDNTSQITVVIFKNKQKLDLKEGQIIEVEAKVIDYKGQLELQANKIKA